MPKARIKKAAKSAKAGLKASIKEIKKVGKGVKAGLKAGIKDSVTFRKKNKDKAPKKPPNKRTGEDFLDKEKTGWGGSRGGKARPLNLEDLRERIKKDKEGRKNRRKTLPYKI